ncbi:hypothetical protein HanIR_Chr16g0795381 [Helianthus annuus]|nr:hypothetical protein HanIR_Chr16g0795381 [Helianthus annuus]
MTLTSKIMWQALDLNSSVWNLNQIRYRFSLNFHNFDLFPYIFYSINFFLNGQRILQMSYCSPHRDTLAFRIGENPHLGPKPVNTRPKARQCGEVKPAQFKDRTSDRRLLA